jgi:hypothetical protein
MSHLIGLVSTAVYALILSNLWLTQVTLISNASSILWSNEFANLESIHRSQHYIPRIFQLLLRLKPLLIQIDLKKYWLGGSQLELGMHGLELSIVVCKVSEAFRQFNPTEET